MAETTPEKTTLGHFSKRRYVVPFGRYVGSTEVEPPADEVLVGREEQRASLIDILISSGRRGSYLVTGRRGTGKTSFVKHCIAEYEESVFSRFLRGNVGRGVWDRLLVVVFWMALLFGALILSELLQLVVPLTGAKDILPWIVFAPIGILLLYPCVYAKVVLEMLLQSPLRWLLRRLKWSNEGPDSETSFSGILAAGLVAFLAGVAWFTRGLGEPPMVGILIPLLGGCYFFVQAVSFERSNHPSRWRKTRQALFHFGLVSYLYLVLRIARSAMSSDHQVKAAVFDHMGFGLILLGAGYILRGTHQLARSGTARKHTRGRQLGASISEAMSSGAIWYMGAGLACLVVGIVTWNWSKAFSELTRTSLAFLGLTALILLLFLVSTWRGRKGEMPRFRPRPGWILLLKALISIVIAVQLAYPILATVPLRRLHPKLEEMSGNICPERSRGLAMCESARFDPEEKGKIDPIFQRRNQEAFWLLALLLIIIVSHLLEYEWIIRPFLRPREDLAYDPGGPAPWDDWERVDGNEDETVPKAHERRRIYRSLAELTLPWIVYKAWLPVLPVSVNLGFDRLDHRQVIQAMLVGLRERYYRTFLAWNSGFANLGRFSGILVLLMLVTLLSAPSLASLREPLGETWYGILNWDLAPKLGGPGDLLVFGILPHQTTNLGFPAPVLSSVTFRYYEIHFRIYHVLLLLLLLVLVRWIFVKIPLLPYRENLRRIEDLLDSLSARTRTTSGFSLWEPARWVYSFFVDEHMRETERDPVDPRTIELAFLQILEDIQKGGFRFPGAARLHLTMPAPEITFVFDELDKLGTRVDPALAQAEEEEAEVLHQERQRSIKLRALLSDLKNILASAPARFIFVGGRDLHDEWLADQTSRQPLLTSIFHTEVYLPSLMTDHNRNTPVSELRLHRRAEEYLRYQHRRAQLLHLRSARKRWRPSFGLPLEGLVYERFIPPAAPELQSSTQVINAATGEELTCEEDRALRRDFVQFLTHRSMGNPKKLKDLLASFVRPAGREVEPGIRWEHAPCRHILRFSDTKVFRLQLIGDIYRHIALTFEERMVQRDDKYAISIFFLTDFLFKFHRRAFSWSNLERVDDLAHIHRLPDLRDLQEEIVNHFSERFLHRMLNGMYAFRFRSDIANEIEHLSRLSPTEMAAFNFTLDESQSLKVAYEAALKGKEEKNPDLVAGIGELYEFDQDFERARYHYRRAIDLLDEGIRGLTARMNAESGEYHPGAPIHDILAGGEKGLKDARLFLSWGSARLRFMLLIGMTYEHARDFERAEAEYRNARTLARALVKAYVDDEGRHEADPKEKEDEKERMFSFFSLFSSPPLAREEKKKHPYLPHASRLHSLKHLNILYQPLFAEAWLSEKFVGSIDTSISLVERNLWELRVVLPFVRKPAELVEDATQTRHANFALTLSQLHNKAADLFFFKGRQPVDLGRIRGLIALERSGGTSTADRQTDGYLLRAHYHYAVGLHELRRYVWQRVESSPKRLSISSEQARTLLPEALPDVLFRAFAGGVNDMAEATLARVSLFGLFDRLRTLKPGDVDGLRALDIGDRCEKWLSAGDRDEPDPALRNWFGRWTWKEGAPSSANLLIEFTGPDSSEKRLAMSLRLCLVGAAHFEKGGYPEDAGRELLQICETVTRYLWWGHTVEAVKKYADYISRPGDWLEQVRQTARRWSAPDGDAPELSMSGIFGEAASDKLPETEGRKYWLFLIDLAIYSLEKASTLFRESRYHSKGNGNEPEDGRYVVGELVPAEALTLLCSLGLASEGCLLDEDRKKRLQALVLKWTGSDTSDFWTLLVHALQRHRYPMINRLNGLKVLIDSLVLDRRVQPLQLDQAREWTEELLDLNAQYDAPLHFTPLHSGTTCALLWLRWVSGHPKREKRDAIERIFRAAQRDLHNSEEMYTMRRAYYEAINDLYYLYDDFNDRQIHFHHAIQMAGAELTSILKSLIDVRDEVREPFGKVS